MMALLARSYISNCPVLLLRISMSVSFERAEIAEARYGPLQSDLPHGGGARQSRCR